MFLITQIYIIILENYIINYLSTHFNKAIMLVFLTNFYIKKYLLIIINIHLISYQRFIDIFRANLNLNLII
jgi:hypothetical protein